MNKGTKEQERFLDYLAFACTIISRLEKNFVLQDTPDFRSSSKARKFLHGETTKFFVTKTLR